ncbi:hypothetical protein RD110_11750 [Rhodoferax koreense]|uniref:Uncharacterized protein n=1 Tax=Rhodoferax koreensis TaxID=1842727 RepID=A0A1P8JVL3_9BURK|nr:hypothetical protein RD110_11750 [Rhodoferax koreense]
MAAFLTALTACAFACFAGQFFLHLNGWMTTPFATFSARTFALFASQLFFQINGRMAAPLTTFSTCAFARFACQWLVHHQGGAGGLGKRCAGEQCAEQDGNFGRTRHGVSPLKV